MRTVFVSLKFAFHVHCIMDNHLENLHPRSVAQNIWTIPKKCCGCLKIIIRLLN